MKTLDTKRIDTEVVLDSLNDSVVTIGLDKKIKYLNKAAERLLGYSKEEAKEMSCAQVVRCAACDHECLLEQTLSTSRNIHDYETVLRNKNGKLVTISTNTVLLRNRSGRVIGGVEIIRDRSQIEALNEALRGKYSFENIIGKNHRMQSLCALLPEMSRSESSVLIEGELGTGRELLAHAIHENGPRSEKPFVKVNCDGLTDAMLACELFGYIKGAFTGAVSNRAGRLELADGGTLFLDEIGCIGSTLQVALLKFLKEKQFVRVGDNRKIRTNIRVIAATHRDIKTAVEEGEFLGELYDQLRSVPIVLPPLRERRDDIPLLVEHFLKRFNTLLGKKIKSVAPAAMEILLNYDYPENIQGLENIIEHAVVLCHGGTILPSHLPRDMFYVKDDFIDQAIKQEDPLKILERQLVLKALSQTDWNYQAAAEKLKISRTTLWRKIKEFGISCSANKSSNG
ncbi:MAG TPA: sigma 54-interacting transcriptional regulator [Nitrospiria bacterium]|nr:sigma 54-interacting transcriptional regulator [Nitrospiria bacterium]